MSAENVIDLAERLPRRAPSESRRVVAVILEDGSVRAMADGERRSEGTEYGAGQISGEGWTMWWQRRDWE